MKNKISHAALGLMLSALPLAAGTDCLKIAAIIKSKVETDASQVVSIVAKHVEASPECSCEIVKTAIQASHADAELVALIVENAILAAPDQMRIIAQCAIAIAPDALPNIQRVLAKLDPHSGESYSSRSAKHIGKRPAKEVSPIQEPASIFNPLDFPGDGPVGPADGLASGGIFGIYPGFDPVLPLIPTTSIETPPPVDPGDETPVNPVILPMPNG